MPESGLRFLIGPILTACLNLGVAGLMGTQGEAAGQEVMPIFPLLFGGGSTATAQKASWKLYRLHFDEPLDLRGVFCPPIWRTVLVVAAQATESVAVSLAGAWSSSMEWPTCMRLSCLCWRALLVLNSLRLVLRTG